METSVSLLSKQIIFSWFTFWIDLGNMSIAEEMLKHALEIRKDKLGKNSAVTLCSKRNLDYVMNKSKCLDEDAEEEVNYLEGWVI
jgi:hypothetical protein